MYSVCEIMWRHFDSFYEELHVQRKKSVKKLFLLEILVASEYSIPRDYGRAFFYLSM